MSDQTEPKVTIASPQVGTPVKPEMLRLAVWVKRTLKATGISIAVAVLVFLATGRNGDLIVWPSELTPIYPRNRKTGFLQAGEPVDGFRFVRQLFSVLDSLVNDHKPTSLELTRPQL